jgi:hypothetical protein
MRLVSHRLAAVVLLAVVSTAPKLAGAAPHDVGADAVKAAFLLNFARFSEWPADSDRGPLIFCVAGDRPLEEALTDTLRGQTMNGRTLEVQHVATAMDAARCHVLYVDASAESMIGALHHLPILTVSEMPRFADSGGIIELGVEHGKMRFAVNVDVASRSGLKLSSRFLSLARIVTE